MGRPFGQPIICSMKRFSDNLSDHNRVRRNHVILNVLCRSFDFATDALISSLGLRNATDGSHSSPKILANHIRDALHHRLRLVLLSLIDGILHCLLVVSRHGCQMRLNQFVAFIVLSVSSIATCKRFWLSKKLWIAPGTSI